MAQEVELKLALLESLSVSDILAGLQEKVALSNVQTRQLRNIYFDTDDLLLNRHKVALRIREVAGAYIQTLKTKGQSVNGVHTRGEWEWHLKGPVLDLSLLTQCDAWPADISVQNLRPVFETNFERTSTVIAFKGSKIELALDLGQIIVGASGTGEIREIELELLSGDSSVLLDLGQSLFDVLPLQSSNISKAERGYRLAHREL